MNKSSSVSPIFAGHEMRIGQGFTARHFAENDFQGMVDPVSSLLLLKAPRTLTVSWRLPRLNCQRP